MAVQEIHVCDKPACSNQGDTYTVMVGEKVVKVDICAKHANETTLSEVLHLARPVKPPPRRSQPRTVDHNWLGAVPVFDDEQVQ